MIIKEINNFKKILKNDIPIEIFKKYVEDFTCLDEKSLLKSSIAKYQTKLYKKIIFFLAVIFTACASVGYLYATNVSDIGYTALLVFIFLLFFVSKNFPKHSGCTNVRASYKELFEDISNGHINIGNKEIRNFVTLKKTNSSIQLIDNIKTSEINDSVEKSIFYIKNYFDYHHSFTKENDSLQVGLQEGVILSIKDLSPSVDFFVSSNDIHHKIPSSYTKVNNVFSDKELDRYFTVFRKKDSGSIEKSFLKIIELFLIESRSLNCRVNIEFLDGYLFISLIETNIKFLTNKNYLKAIKVVGRELSRPFVFLNYVKENIDVKNKDLIKLSDFIVKLM